MVEFGIVVLIALIWLFIYFKRREKLALKARIDSDDEAERPLKAELKPKPEAKVSVEDNVKTPVAAELLETGRDAGTVPEDSALRRHYFQNIASQGDSMAPAGEAAVTNISAIKEVAKVSGLTSVIPEDAVLKRHFIHQLTTEIAATMPARPTDSALKRHYDEQLLSAVASKLEALK